MESSMLQIPQVSIFTGIFPSGAATTATNINFYKAMHGLKDLLEALVYPPGILVTSLANADINL